MTELRSDDVVTLANRELDMIVDQTVRQALTGHFIRPQQHLRNWDYGAPGEQYPCWAIAKDVRSDSAIVYSAHGHGPSSPWGIVLLSSLWFGMDSAWFLRLEDAFVESHMSAALPIWDVVANGEPIFCSLPLDEAYAHRDALNAALARPVHRVRYRSRHPDGVR